MQDMSKSLILVVALLGLSFLSGCQDKPKRVVVPPNVTVAQPVQREVTRYLEYTGTTAALESVDIRARVAGFLEKMCFQPHAKVKAGDLLFVIDPRQYQAAVNQTEALLEGKQADFKLAKTEEEIWKTLESKEAVSPLKLQEKTARSDVSKAGVDQARADLDNARLNLEYTQVTSPINGRVSRNLVDVGNLVGATEKTLLTSVVNDESIYCYFNANELDLLSVKRAHPGQGAAGEVTSWNIKAFLGLADETGYPHEGRVDFVDTQISSTTGTIQVRAVFPNPDGFLMPGMFARVRIPVDKKAALLVPEVAVQFDQGGRYLLVVNEEKTVEQRRITPGRLVDEMRVVEKGLAPKDQVIVAGIQRARPGSKVNPVSSPAPAPQSGSKSETEPRNK
ncbi:MAG: efflux RND transporter periplasmic adaptor subunit [Thermodesulfobacteriota bacterium]